MPNPPGRGGLGNPHEENFFFENFRDWGQSDPNPMVTDKVFDPTECRPKRLPPGQEDFLVEMECRFKRFLKKNVFLSKRPSFVEPPFFSKPITKTIGVAAPSGGVTTQIFSFFIEDRQRAVVTTIGVNVDQPTILQNQLLSFWFALDDPVRGILPLFDDQTPVAVLGRQLATGQTTVLPGSVEEPYPLIQNGVSFQVKGRTEILFMVQNNSPATTVNIRAVMSLYRYWLPKADAFESADNQV